MPTTTRYGWQTPSDTELVKDGAAAIRNLGDQVDTDVAAIDDRVDELETVSHTIRRRTSAQSIAAGGWATLSTNAVEHEQLGGRLTASSTTVTVAAGGAGVYHLAAGVEWEPNAGGWRELALRVNGAEVARSTNRPVTFIGAAGHGGNNGQQVSREVALADGDQVDAVVFHYIGTSGSLSILGTRNTHRTVRFLAPL